MSQPVPIAKGNLAKTPLAHVLVHIEQNQLTGTLVVWPNGGESETSARIYLEARCVRRILLPHSETQPEAGFAEGLLSLFSRAGAPYAFFAEDLVGDAGVVGEIDILELLARALRTGLGAEPIDRILSKLGEQSVRMRSNVDLGRFSFEPQELAFLDLVRASPASVTKLSRLWKDAAQVRWMVYLLTITKAVEAFDPKAVKSRARRATPLRSPRSSSSTGAPIAANSPPRPAKREPPRRKISSIPPSRIRPEEIPELPEDVPSVFDAPPPPPPSLGPGPTARWKAIAARATQLEKEDYFQVLSIDKEASNADIQKRYLALAKEWHPDRLPPELDGVRSWADQIFSQINAARDTLMDPARRRAYRESLAAGAGTPEADREVHQIVEAAMAFQKVEILERRRSYAEALTEVERALTLHDQDGDFFGMKAWLLFQIHGAKGEHRTALDLTLRQALKLNEKSERANYTKGLLLKLEGHNREALRHFQKVVDVNSDHIDANRELRMGERRASGRHEKPSTGGLFDRFFKK